MHSPSFSRPPEVQSTDFPYLIGNRDTDGCITHSAHSGVSEGRHSHAMTDAEREEAIARAGRAVERHMATWHREGCMAARGDADRALRLMELLIRGRSAEQVRRMQQAQAERMAREPGAEFARGKRFSDAQEKSGL